MPRLERFAQEARATAALNHPNILAIYDVSVDAETPYLVAELLEGATLADRLRDAPDGLSVRRAVEIAQQVAHGLADAHARGIVHRDVKPANLFITADGRVKILDFGLARPGAPSVAATETRAVLTDPGTVMGSDSYMAPEQVRGHEAYIVPFLRDGPRVRVSADGGVQPNWRLDQRELFYLVPDGRMMSAALTITSEAITVATPAALFDTTLVPSFSGVSPGQEAPQISAGVVTPRRLRHAAA